MKGTNIGEFEELVLLAVAILQGDAYGINISDIIEKEAGRSVTLSTIHNALYRLEDKGYVTSSLGGATSERGGRRKRFFQITAIGQATLNEAYQLRNRLWGLIPGTK